jgi:glycyl-tRNA synthetase beta chain
MDGKAEALFYDSTAKGARWPRACRRRCRSLAKLPIPKVMTYQLADGWTDVKFVRPAHGLVALHGEHRGAHAGAGPAGRPHDARPPLRGGQPTVCSPMPTATPHAESDGAVIASFAERRAEIVRQLRRRSKVGGGARADRGRRAARRSDRAGRAPNVLVCQFERSSSKCRRNASSSR